MSELSYAEKHILNQLLQNPLLPQDKIWLDSNEKRLKKLKRMGFVEKQGNVWSLTELGKMCAVAAEGSFNEREQKR